MLAAVAAALTSVGALSMAHPAHSFSDYWGCNVLYSAQTCWSGAGYHSYIEVTMALPSGESRPYVCAKGRTAAGNTRTGSGDGCNTYARTRTSCFSYHEPHSAGYFYWAGTGSPVGGAGEAHTPSSRVFC